RQSRAGRLRLFQRRQSRASRRPWSAIAFDARLRMSAAGLRAQSRAIPNRHLPYGRQLIEEDDIAAVAEALRGDYLTTGPYVDRFENALAKTVGAKHAVVCSNGTAALHMAARALNLGPGTKVIVPVITFLATASAPHINGAEIVFADVDPE